MTDGLGKGQALPPVAQTQASQGSSTPSQGSQAPTPNTVRIPSTQILPQTTAPLNIGDLLRFNVRSNPTGELGTLYYQGQLIKTALPSNVSAGDRLLARLEATGEQVVFKILEHIKTDGSSTLGKGQAAVTQSVSSSADGAASLKSPLEELTKQVQSILERTQPQANDAVAESRNNPLSRSLTAAATPVPIEEPLKSGELQQLVETISQTIGKGDALGNAEHVSGKIQLSATGSAADILRQAADAIKLLLKDTPYQLPTTDRFLVLLQGQLTSLLESIQTGSSREITSRLVDVLLHAINEELKLQKGGSSTKASDALKLALTDLKLGKQDPAALEKHIESALNRVQNYLGTSMDGEASKRVDLKVVSDLRTLVNRLESLAQTHDTLAALNPVMAALGEPALILFPFILPGLLHHSEISIDPNAHRDKKGGKKSGAGQDAYQRIQIRLPLPNLGPLEVDIAHRGTEILARVVTRDERTAKFLLEQSENLRLSLQTANFELIDYSTEHSAALTSLDGSKPTVA